MSDLRATNFKGRTSGSVPNMPDGVVVGSAVTISSSGIDVGVGVITATSFAGDATGLTGTPNIDCGTGSFTGDVDIADKIIHTGDTNTAIRFPAADTFTVETGGSERVRVNSSGFVGVNTDGPGRLFTVHGGTSEGVIQITNDTSGPAGGNGFELLHFTSGETQLLNRENGAMRFDTNNTERLRIDSAGDMGLGVTPNNFGSQRTFHIKGPSGEGAAIRLQDNGDTADSDDYVIYKNASAAYLRVNGTDPLRFYLNGAERMQLDSSGRLSIANDTPGSFNAGADDLVIGSSSGDRGITLYTGTSDQGALYFADGTSGAQQYAGGINYGHSDNQLRFLSNGSTNMRLDSAGRLLVGPASSSFNISAVFEGNSDNSASAAGILLQRGTSTPPDGQELGNIYFADSAAGTGAIILAKRDGGTWSGSSKPGRLEFHTTADGATSSTERIRIHNGGVVSIPNGIELGSGVDATAANTLDDYEEGTFTPTINTGFTAGYNTQSGRYTKIGNTVHFFISIDLSSLSGSSSDTYAEVEGLPFTATNTGNIDNAVTVAWQYALGNSVYHAYIEQNATHIVLLGEPASGTRTHLNPGQVWDDSDGRIALSGTYTTAA